MGQTDVDTGTKKYLNDFLKKPTQENGKVYELLVYAWLERNFPCYVPQIHIEREKCFKASENGYDADGRIEETIVFDVKQFGITLPHIATLQKNYRKNPGGVLAFDRRRRKSFQCGISETVFELCR